MTPELKRLLEAERRSLSPPLGAKARVWNATAAAVGMPPLAETPAPDAAVSVPAAGAIASGAAQTAGPLAALLKPLTVLAFLGGAAAGVGGTALVVSSSEPPIAAPTPWPQPTPWPEPEPRIVYVERGVVSRRVVHEKTPGVVSTPAPEPIAVETPYPPESLAEERAILERARTALGIGDEDTALAELLGHRIAFPEGRLAEERDAMLVFAHAASGDKVEADAAANTFRAKYPASLFLPAVEAALVTDRAKPRQ